jgi:hypothetical protein
MTRTVSDDIDALRAAMTGTVIGPRDADYDAARTVWNADIDRRPAIIARCASPADVATAVVFATRHGLEIAVRGGAHSVPGASVVDGGLVVDLSGLREVTVDPVARRARVAGGALLGDLDAAAQAHGLAVPAGLISHTGVGGLTLGGGMGWLTRMAGLSIDNLVSAQVVTADGRILRVADDENPELFWAVRGGGGNFGVVTEFEFRLHEVGPLVQVAILFWGLDQGPDVLRLARDVVPALPPELNIVIAGMNAPPEPFVPEQYRMQPGYGLIVTGFGSADVHAETVSRLGAALPPLFEFVAELPYVELQKMLDKANDWGFHCYDKGCYVEQLSDAVIDVVAEHLPRKLSPLSILLFYRLDGAYSRVGDDATAFSGGRSPRFAVFIVAVCPTPELLVKDREWVRSFWQALRPHSYRVGTYVNAVADFEDDDTVRAAYGPLKHDRLARIKAEYDPGNVFHRNANIKPATQARPA